MRWFPVVSCFLAALLVTPAMAQVHRCKDASGKTIYSDAPCATSQTGGMIERQKSQEMIYEERVRADEANERKQIRRERELATQSQQQSQDFDRRQNQVPSAASGRPISPHECNQAKRNLDIASGGIYRNNEEKRQRVNAAKAKVAADCGGPAEPLQAERAPPARPSAPPALTSTPPPPSVITHCNEAFCYDNQGGVYHKVGPNVMTGPNGRTCSGAGPQWTCN